MLQRRELSLRAKSGLMQRSKKDSLFDHLIGQSENIRGYLKPECLGRSKIYYELELSWL